MDLERGRNASVKEKANHPIATIGLLIFLALNITMLVVGFVKKDECPIQEKIPIFLIVAGAIGILSKSLPFINRKLDWCLVDLVISVIYLIEFIWIIVGSVWVYQIYKPNYNPSKGPYCSESAYLLSFWLITIQWIIMAITTILGCLCCCCPCLKCFKK